MKFILETKKYAPQSEQKYFLCPLEVPLGRVCLYPHLGHGGFFASRMSFFMSVVRSSLHSGQYHLGTLIWRMSVYPLILIGLPHFGHWGLFIASPLRISLLHSLHFHACIFFVVSHDDCNFD